MPRRRLSASVVAILCLSLFLAPAATYGATVTHLVISEVLYDPASTEPGSEFVEVYNPTDLPASLLGWTIKDNSASDPLPGATVAPGQFLVIASSQADFLAANPGYSGPLVSLESPIGNGLSNTGDAVLLVDAAGAVVDAMSYGSDASGLNPPCPDIPEGQSLSRTSPQNDGDNASDWSPGVPSPGAGWVPLPPPTPTNTATSSPTLTPTRTATATRTPSPTRTWTPTRTTTPSGTPTVTASPTATASDTPQWTPTSSSTPSPTDPATPPETATATQTPDNTPSPTRSPTATASRTPTRTPSSTPSPSDTPSPTLTATSGSWPALLISEVFYDPPQSGTDTSYEFVELYNPSGGTVSIEGWRIRDNGGEDSLPAGVIAPGAHLVIAASRDGFFANFPSFSGNLIALENTIGNGLSNTGDRVLLLAPDGSESDKVSYGSDATAFDPACPDVGAGASLARVPSGRDTNTAGDWHEQTAPNPGAQGSIPSTPTLTPSRTPSPTRTPTVTRTPSPTRTPTGTSMPTNTPTPVLTPTVTETYDPTRTPTRTPTPSTATVTPTVTSTVGASSTSTPSATPSATPTQRIRWSKIYLSEVLYDPIQEGTDGDWEFVEIWNGDEEKVDLTGWRIGDNNSEDILPAFILEPGAFVVIAAKESAFRAGFPAFSGQLIVLSGNIGDGLSNTGDAIGLITPDGTISDAMSYGAENSVFDPPCARVKPGESLARWNGADTDSAADWITEPAPNPGAASQATPTPTATVSPTLGPTATPTETRPVTPTRTPTLTRTMTPTRTVTPTSTNTPTATALPPDALKVMLNEILPNPVRVDWDRDGQADFMDEWVELYNGSDATISLEGWQLSDAEASYSIPTGTVIWPRGFLLLYRGQTRLSLSDWRDAVTLTRNDGSFGDTFTYDRSPGEDRSYCRNGDGAGSWTSECEVTPGGPNRLLPPAPTAQPAPNPTATTAAPQNVQTARQAKEDTRVTITGSVTLPPGLIDRTIYIEDSTGGVRVYLRKGDFGALKLGDRIRVTGWTRLYYGETELSVPDPSYLTVLGPGSPVTPKSITAAGLGEANEGRLVQATGTIVKYETRALVLKGRGGQLRVYFPESLSWRRPYVNIGDVWSVQGIVRRYTAENSTVTEYEIVPRFKTDLVSGPLTLPVTGGQDID